MTDQQPHAPCYEEVREATESDVIFLELGAFDRFLAARDARIEAAAEQRGAIKALREAATQMESTADTLGENYMLPGDIIAWLRHRADQIEGDIA